MFSLFRKHKSKSINNKLLQAVQEDNLKAVQKALKQKADVNIHSGKLREPLILTAVKFASLPVIEELIKAGADVNDFDNNYRTALLCACEYKKGDVISFLLEHHAKPNMTDKNGFTALATVFRNLPRRINSANRLFLSGRTSVSFEKELKNEVQIVQKLLEKGASFKHLKSHHDNPLFIAIQALNKDLIEMILKQDIYITDAKDKWGFTALTAACEIKSPQIAQPIIRMLLNAGENINNFSGWAGTALKYAVENENNDIVRQLLEAGANPNLSDSKKAQTPLMTAVQKGNLEIVQQLVKAGADVNLQDSNGDTALLMALSSGNYTPEMFKIIKLLIKHNSNAQIQNNYHETAWDILLKEANPRILLFMQNVITQIQNKQATPEEMLEKLNIGMEKLIETNKNNFKKCVWPTPKTQRQPISCNEQHVNA